MFDFLFILQIGSSAQIYRNATGHVVGYGGVFWEELNWLSRQLNFRSISFKIVIIIKKF